MEEIARQIGKYKINIVAVQERKWQKTCEINARMAIFRLEMKDKNW